jgi:hypothetical protein
MGYRIEKEGYEYRGVKLGQKCICFDEETIVIGFDDHDCVEFIVVSDVNNDSSDEIATSDYVDIILYKHEKDCYVWASLDDITLLPYEENEITPQPQISPIHAIDILEDEISKLIENYPTIKQSDQLCWVNECIELIKNNYVLKEDSND